MDPALSAAAGALLIALLNEARAMSRARAARVERDEANEAMRQTVLQPDRRVEPDGDTGDRPPSASAQTHEHGEHHEHHNEAVPFPDHPTE